MSERRAQPQGESVEVRQSGRPQSTSAELLSDDIIAWSSVTAQEDPLDIHCLLSILRWLKTSQASFK
ncbi:hypothetical protein F2P79_000434 [Pimephales promelas]|nr:hypothetical protein F2P79_000434 [Pimephales promelas]